MRKRLSKKEAMEVIEILERTYPKAKAQLNFSNEFELLIATILSAQCTDVVVNKTTENLFRELKKPRDYIDLGEERLIEKIKSCGLANNKSKNIISTCKILEEEYGGKVPDKLEELIKLPGVGRKTANVVLSNAFNIPAIAVDTHVFRVSNRIGLANSSNVENTEKDLMDIIPKEKWSKTHHLLIFHGRNICKSRKPLCKECPINDKCLYYINNILDDK
ncbi:MAG: endonuclease III [Tissierellales bacterium]|nr:endonuclease III [Tissierellales bacterium]